MSKAKHTPGPWNVSEDGIIYSGTPETCTELGFAAQGTDGIPQARANGLLMAASPDLLAALKDIQEFCDDPNGSESPENLAHGLARLLPAARAAIAKAEGR